MEKSLLKYDTRPRVVTWLALGVLIFSILFMIRLFLSYRMPNLPIIVPRWYISLTGFVWGMSGLILSYGLFRTRPWALHIFCWASPIFVVWYWTDRLLFLRSEYSRVSWPASAILTIAALGVIFWVQRRSDVRVAFKENDK